MWILFVILVSRYWLYHQQDSRELTGMRRAVWNVVWLASWQRRREHYGSPTAFLPGEQTATAALLWPGNLNSRVRWSPGAPVPVYPMVSHLCTLTFSRKLPSIFPIFVVRFHNHVFSVPVLIHPLISLPRRLRCQAAYLSVVVDLIFNLRYTKMSQACSQKS